MINKDIGVVVVATKRKKPITPEVLSSFGVSHFVSISDDYDYPEGNFEHEKMCGTYKLGQYRCYMGHKKALMACNKKYTLVLEDDLGINNPNWITHINNTYLLAETTDILNYHQRRATPSKHFTFSNNGHKYHAVTDLQYAPISYGIIAKRGLGSLAYLVGPNGKENIINTPWDGMPIDVVINNKMDFIWIKEPDLFIHDEKYGSATENKIINVHP